MYQEWIKEGQLRKYLRVNRREAEEGMDVEKDLREMKVKRWRKKAGNREEWVSIIKETEAL
jgi:plasmid maintenance system killer protein